MSNTKTVMSQAANTQGIPLDITDVFSTYLWAGNNGSQTITNGIDLLNEGGLVWFKNRTTGNLEHKLVDTERGLVGGGSGPANAYYLQSDTTNAQGDRAWAWSFLENGFSFNKDYTDINATGEDYASWTFRKAPKFFDVVTYTGTGSAQNISHNLGSVPGVVIVKDISGSGNSWTVYHRSAGNTGGLLLNDTNAFITSTTFFNDTTPTDTQFTVGTATNVNQSGRSFVAYLFAHNDGDGGFGPDGDQDIIKCGSYTGNGSYSGPSVDLGFEPQWVMIKRATGGNAPWMILDNMRGLVVGDGDKAIEANNSNQEGYGILALAPTATGFDLEVDSNAFNRNGETYIYIAIRRGPLAPPESATEVFDVSTRNASEPAYTSGFPVDFAFARAKNIANNWDTGSRLQQGKRMFTNLDNAEASNSNMMFDYQEGWSAGTGASTDYLSWMWKRAPNYFDVVAYSGNQTAGHNVSHNLGVAPEMMWVKDRTSSSGFNWQVYHSGIGATKFLRLNTTNAETTSSSRWNDTAPTSSVFSLGDSNRLNATGEDFIAYLFASLPGISKVGSYTGSNSVAVEVDCGFTSGARFVLIKRTDATGDWYIYDSVRGIVSNADDPYLLLNTTDAEAANTNNIEPLSSGFKLTVQGSNPISINGGNYIFYAIA
jgi:hypothetical protein